MSFKSAAISLCRGALTVTSLSMVAVVSLPSDVLSLTIPISDVQEEAALQLESGINSSPTSVSNTEPAATQLIADRDSKKGERGRRGDDDDDDDDDKKQRGRRGDDDDDDDDRKRGGYDRPYRVFKVKNWNSVLKCARLQNSGRNALVVHLDILEKPVTSYANTVYTLYAYRNNSWVQVYSSTGARLIDKQAGRFILQPEVIDFNQLRLNGINLSGSQLKVVAQVRYDTASGRDQRVVFEDIWNYSSITQISSVQQITAIGVTTTNTTNTTTTTTTTTTTNTQTGGISTSGGQSVTLVNGFRITYLGVSYSGNNSTWRYYVEELPKARDLSNWVLGIPSCARVVSASPRGEFVNLDPNARIRGVKWQPGGGFQKGEFSVTLDKRYTVGSIDVAAKGPDVARGVLVGPSCSTR